VSGNAEKKKVKTIEFQVAKEEKKAGNCGITLARLVLHGAERNGAERNGTERAATRRKFDTVRSRQTVCLKAGVCVTR